MTLPRPAFQRFKPAEGRLRGLASKAILCGLWAAASSACQRPTIVPPDLNPPAIASQADLPDYVELVERYNVNAGALERVFARTDVELAWRTEDGRARQESGDGRLIFERPLSTAFTVEVLGDIKLWAGSDEQGFWLFDEFDRHVAYYGSYGQPLQRGLPLPVQPEALPYLLGLMPIDSARRPPAPEVEQILGYHVIEPPGLNLRLMLHPETARPVRVDLIDPRGVSIVTCLLEGDLPVGESAQPLAVLPAKADVYPVAEPGEESRLTVRLSRPTTDSSKIRKRFFTFSDLVKAMKPREVINLNAPTISSR